MRKAFFFLAVLLAAGSTAEAQLPFLRARPPVQPELTSIDAQRAAFSTAAGSDTVMFGVGSAILVSVLTSRCWKGPWPCTTSMVSST